MGTISGQINLLKLKNARRVQAGNVKGIFIPIYDNPTIYAEGKGAYLKVRIVPKEATFNDITYTHFIAASLTKDQREELAERMGEEELRSLTPILGNAKEIGPEPATYDKIEISDDDTSLRSSDGFALRESDLPFDM